MCALKTSLDEVALSFFPSARQIDNVSELSAAVPLLSMLLFGECAGFPARGL
jgi:hypothetical protein